MALLVKNLPAMWETLVRSLGWEDPLEKEKATYSIILAWRIPWTTVYGVAKSWTRLNDLHFQPLPPTASECTLWAPSIPYHIGGLLGFFFEDFMGGNIGLKRVSDQWRGLLKGHEAQPGWDPSHPGWTSLRGGVQAPVDSPWGTEEKNLFQQQVLGQEGTLGSCHRAHLCWVGDECFKGMLAEGTGDAVASSPARLFLNPSSDGTPVHAAACQGWMSNPFTSGVGCEETEARMTTVAARLPCGRRRGGPFSKHRIDP